MKHGTTKRSVLTIGRFAVGLAIVGALFWAIDLRDIPRIFSAIRPLPLALFCLAVFADRALMAYKWNLLLRARGITISVWQAIRLYYVGLLVGTMTPGELGLEAYRVTALSRFNKNQVVISTIILERGIGMAVTGVFAAIGLPLSLSYLGIEGGAVAWTILLAALLTVAVVTLSLTPSIVKTVGRAFTRLSENRFAKRISDFYAVYAENREYRGTLVAFTALTALEVVVGVGAKYLAARSLGFEVSFVYFLCVMPLANVIVRLPITVQGIGVQEGIFAYLLVKAGYSAAEGLSLSIFIRILGVLVVFLPASIMLGLSPVKLNPSPSPATGIDTSRRLDTKSTR